MLVAAIAKQLLPTEVVSAIESILSNWDLEFPGGNTVEQLGSFRCD